MNGINTQPCFSKNIVHSIRRTPWLFVCMLVLMLAATVGAPGIARANAAQQCTSSGGGGLGPLPSSQALCDANGAWWLSYAASQAAGNSGYDGAGYTCSNIQPTSYVLFAWDNGTPGGNSYTVPVSCTSGYSVSPQPNPNADNGRCCNGVGHPINPATGNVYSSELDIASHGQGNPLEFRRFYNSADATGIDGVIGWRHSYARSITTVYQNISPSFAGTGGTASPLYATLSAACTSGFSTIQSSVTAWAGATATYNNGACVLSNGTVTIGTLQIQSGASSSISSSPLEYDLIRDNGQTLRYTVQNGVINNQPGVSIRLAVTGSGFTVTDDDDSVEVYNSAGMLQSVTSRAGVVQTISCDSNGLFHEVIDSFGNSLIVTRNAQGRIGSIALSGGGTVQYGYDNVGRLSTVTNLDNTSRSYIYGNASFPNAITSLVDESGTTYSSWGYDTLERATSTYEAGGADAQALVYNSDGSVTVTDALGAVRTFSYSRVGDINKVIGISGSQCPTCQDSAATTYDSAGWVASRTDYNGNLTCYANDPVRGLELVRVEGFTPGNTCPTNLSSYTPATGTLQRKITTQWISTWREPALITEPNRTTSVTFDSQGNVLTKTVTDTSVSPNVARTWTYTYNSYGQVLTIDGPRTDVSDVTTVAYYTCSTGTQCGQIQTITNALSQITTFNTYNAYGQPLTITDPNGVVTTVSYDARQRLTSSGVGTEITSYSYWPIGLLKTVTLPDSSTISYSYDGAHRLTKITNSAGNYINYTLDALGNRTADNIYDPTSTLRRTHTRVFNTLSQLYQDINAAGTAAVTTTLGYDAQGNQTSINAPLSRNTSKTFDALNRLSQITDPNSGITHLGYDANGNVASVIDPRNLTTSYTHNGFNDVATIASPDTGTTTNTFDSGGNLKTVTDARGAVATRAYDALNRVTQIAYSDQTINLTYDSGTNGVGRLTGASDANHSMDWTYDALGRVNGKGQVVAGVTKSVGYSYTNGDLATLVTPSGQSVTYGYTNHLPVATLQPNGSSISIYYIHSDHLGTPRKITQPSSNTLAWRWDPDTFGSLAPNQNPAGLGTFVYNLRFPGQYYLPETGLHYNHFRDYDPQTGRYIESDPVGLYGGSHSTYAYALVNPISYRDPLGLIVQLSVNPLAPAGDAAALVSAYSQIASTPTGSALINALENSPIVYTITNEPDWAWNTRSDFNPYTNTIHVDPSFHPEIPVDNACGHETASTVVQLEHELWHAATGSGDEDLNLLQNVNPFRAEFGLPPQTAYGAIGPYANSTNDPRNLYPKWH